jgi:hypothetical protein
MHTERVYRRIIPRVALVTFGRWAASVLRKLGTSRSKAWTGRAWETVTPENYDHYIMTSFIDG